MILILNGPINSGKSTVAEILSKRIANCSNVEVDKVREFILAEGSNGWEISFKAAVQLARSFLEAKLNVIFSYHIAKADYNYIVEQISELDSDIFAFTLKPSKEVLLQNRGSRQLNDYLIQKLNTTYDGEEYRGDYGEMVDNTNQTPEETALYIYAKIKHTLKEHN